MDFLLTNGADIDIKAFGGWTALHKACFDGVEPVFEFLFKMNANLNEQTDLGFSPLMMTIEKGCRRAENYKIIIDNLYLCLNNRISFLEMSFFFVEQED